MKRTALAVCFTLCFTFCYCTGQVEPIKGLTPETLLGGAENLKIVTGAKEVTVSLDTKPGGGNTSPPTSIPVSEADARKAVAALSDAANFGVNGSTFQIRTNPAVVLHFKADAGTVNIVIDFKSSEMAVFRDGKFVPRTFNKNYSIGKNSFLNGATAAFIGIAKKAFPDDPCIKALPPPVMSTADMINAFATAATAYYDYYHAIPETPENYVVTAALTGKTRDHIAYIELNPGQISPNGKILDEWGTPLRFIFTQDTSKPIQAWSAGKDRIFGTADDISKPDALPQ